MTNDNEDKILTQLREIHDDIHALRLCITGDKLKGVVGVVDVLETHRRELYGNEATKDVGLKDLIAELQKRIAVLEADRTRIYVGATALSASVGVIWAVAKHVFGK